MTAVPQFERATPSGVALRRFRITSDAAATITGWAWDLASGTMQLVELPDALATFWNVAFQEGRASRDGEVRALRVDRDRHWLVAFGGGHQYVLDRLDQAAELADRPDVDDVLDEAWRVYLASLDNLRAPVRLPAPTTEDRTKEVA